MPSFRERQAELEGVTALAKLEEEYVAAKEAYREDKSDENRDRFKTAKDAFDEGRATWRTTEVEAGRRTVGASVTDEEGAE